KAVGQIIKGVLWQNQKPLTIAELRISLKKHIGVSLADDVIEKQMAILTSQQAVTQLLEGEYKLTESARQQLTKSHDIAVVEQESCYVSFSDSCAANCPSLDPQKVWEYFQSALVNALHIAGANLFHLL